MTPEEEFMEMKKKILNGLCKFETCPECKEDFTDGNNFGYLDCYGACSVCMTSERVREQEELWEKEDFKDRHSECLECKEHVSDDHINRDGVCSDCQWRWETFQ